MYTVIAQSTLAVRVWLCECAVCFRPWQHLWKLDAVSLCFTIIVDQFKLSGQFW